MSYLDMLKKWQAFDGLEVQWKEDLQRLLADDKRAEDAFYKNLEFGTGGMRGEIGAGTNRMNTYTVRKASKGVADYVKSAGSEAMERGIVIAHDSRRNSPEFALEAAKTFAANGVKAYLYEGPRTTPQLSFSIRELDAFMGIVVTASHNPPEYNGYKVYGEDGAQLNLEAADAVIAFVNAAGDELSIAEGDVQALRADGMIVMIGEELDQAYINQLKTVQNHPVLLAESDLSAVFTPLHGASGETVRRLFKEIGYTNIQYVEEQMKPDGEFPTVASPNPEEASAFEYAIRQGNETAADLLVAADPDGDRVGVAVFHHGGYHLFTGNQTGAILLEYLLTQMKETAGIPSNGRVFKTIVTSDLGKVIAEHHGASTEDVLTGFKFIGEKINQYEKTGEYQFLFGYEESYGYLIKDFARDKDAIQSVLAVVEAAAFYKKENKTLVDVLQNLYERHGWYKEGLVSVTKKGVEGAMAIKGALEKLRKDPVKEIGGIPVSTQEDYSKQERTFAEDRSAEPLTLPKSDVLKYFLEDGSWVCVRPSGTEPKIKYYFSVKGSTEKESEDKLSRLKEDFTAKMEKLF